MELSQLFVTSVQRVLKVVFDVLATILQPLASRQQRPHDKKKKTVVIVGANFSGLAALWKLEKSEDLNILVIDKNEYFEYTPGVLRLFCNPKLFTSLAKALQSKQHKFLQGTVTSITKTSLLYTTGREVKPLSFDYLILATGTAYTHPITAGTSETTLAERETSWKIAHQKLNAAKRILILGGGAVGVELAAEIVDHYDHDTHVTLVDASPSLVPLFPKATGEYAKMWLTQKGVDLRLGSMLKSWNDTSCTFQDGTVLTADLVYVCFGGKGNTTMLQGSPKRVAVSDSLQMTDNQFCCGDVAFPPTEANQQAFHAEMQGKLAARNVLRLAQGQTLLKYPYDMTETDQMPLVYVLSLGRYNGVVGFNELVVPGPIAPIVKFIIEYTKVLHMEGKVVGKLIWAIGDVVVVSLSRTIIQPKPKKQ